MLQVSGFIQWLESSANGKQPESLLPLGDHHLPGRLVNCILLGPGKVCHDLPCWYNFKSGIRLHPPLDVLYIRVTPWQAHSLVAWKLKKNPTTKPHSLLMLRCIIAFFHNISARSKKQVFYSLAASQCRGRAYPTILPLLILTQIMSQGQRIEASGDSAP